MDLWPLAVHFALVVVLAVVMVALSYVLGQRHHEKATGEPYESGIQVTGSARGRLSVDFYLVALLFVIFDLEVAFLFSWAIAARELGWAGYGGLLVFVGILVVGLVYEWRRGALDWGWAPAAGERARAARETSRQVLADERGGPRSRASRKVERSAT